MKEKRIEEQNNIHYLGNEGYRIEKKKRVKGEKPWFFASGV